VNSPARRAGPAFAHLVADFERVSEAQLGDASLLSGLLIAAASAAGMTMVGTPDVRRLTGGGLAATLLLEDCHMVVHTLPDRGLLLLDVLAPPTHDPRKAFEVFARRLSGAQIRSEQRPRG
jgi:S-adenosylmethionine/arginine decarboxylase-like enzyme